MFSPHQVGPCQMFLSVLVPAASVGGHSKGWSMSALSAWIKDTEKPMMKGVQTQHNIAIMLLLLLVIIAKP